MTIQQLRSQGYKPALLKDKGPKLIDINTNIIICNLSYDAYSDLRDRGLYEISKS